MKRKNVYRTPSNFPGFTPYVYFIRHTPTGLWYIGSKYSSNAHPDYFFKNYFTSSKLIQEIIHSDGVENFEVRILKTFKTAKEAIAYEHRLIERTNAVNSHMSVNMANTINASNAIHNNFKTFMVSNPETRKCIRLKIGAPIPSGFQVGNINANGQKETGRKWYHDPISGNSFQVYANQLPEPNWVIGRGPKFQSPLDGNQNIGTVVVNDGLTNKFIKKGEPIPDGFVLGSKTITRKTNAGRRTITNGLVDRFIEDGQPIPDGFFSGGNLTREKLPVKPQEPAYLTLPYF